MDAFVYGTLRNPERVEGVLGRAVFGPDARLLGLRRVEARYPTLAPGGSTSGRILRLNHADASARTGAEIDVDADTDIEALDSYEGVDRGLYVRIRIPSDEGELWTYVGDPDALGVDVEWPENGPLKSCVERYVETHDVRVET